MTNTYDTFGTTIPELPRGFLVRDLIRFFIVDIIIGFCLKILLWLNFFPTPGTYVLAILGSKLVLFAYLVWLIRDRRDSWPETGATSAGPWWAWPASLALYAACYPVLLWFGKLNVSLLSAVYGWLGWGEYAPEAQDVMMLLFSDVVGVPVRAALVFFTILAGPFMEELAFRGVGLDAYRRSRGLIWAWVWTSLLFGLYHFSLTLLLPLSLLGALFFAVRILSKSLWCAVFIHCLHNALTLAIQAHNVGWLKLPWLGE